MTEPLDLDPIAAREAAATAGPWEPYPQYGHDFYAYLGGEYLRGVGDLNFGTGDDAEADLAFVLAARQDVPELLAEVRRLRAELAARPGCPDPIECDHEAALEQIRTTLAETKAEEARIRDLVAATRDLVGGDYRRRWESTVLEAKRQAARADAAEARAEEAVVLAHSWLYHQGSPCPTPGDCVDGHPKQTPTSADDCGCVMRVHPGHYPSCPTRTAAPAVPSAD